MEYRFENVRSYDKKTLLEYQYKVGCRWSIIWGIVSFLLMLIYIAMAQSDPYDWIMVVTCIGLMIHYFTWPYRFVHKNEKNALEYYNGKIPEVYTRMGEQIAVEDVDSTFTLDYSKIERVISLKHGYYLRYAKKSALLIDPKGFTKGTFQEFKVFLREKRPDLKIPE